MQYSYKRSAAAAKSIDLLVKRIHNAVTVKGLQLKQCQEWKDLKQKCCDVDIAVAFTAFEGIKELVNQKTLGNSQTLSSLIALLPSVTHYPPLVTTIGNILLQHLKDGGVKDRTCDTQCNFSSRTHPFVMVLEHDIKNSWNAVFDYIQYLLFSPNEIQNKDKIEILRPFFLYVFLDPELCSLSNKSELFSVLLKQIHHYEIKCVIIEILSWLSIDNTYCQFVWETFYCLLRLPNEDNKFIIGAFTPHLARIVKWRILNGYNPILWINLLSQSLKINDSEASTVLYILSDVIPETPAPFLNNVVEVCSNIIYSFCCNKFIAYKFAAICLTWLVNPSSMVQPVLKTFENVITFLNLTSKHEQGNKWKGRDVGKCNIQILQNCDHEVKFSTEVVAICELWNDDKAAVIKWLKELNGSNNLLIQNRLHSILCGLVLFVEDDEIIEICMILLQKLSSGNSDLSFFQFCLYFFKLSRETNPKRQLTFLQGMANTVNSKENIPLVIGIIETFKSSKMEIMWPLLVDLYLKLWKTDNRIYPYLHKLLVTSPTNAENLWEVNIMKTIALKEICKASPELHGKNLVGKLSEILNDCDNCISGIPSSIAIEAVTELCRASVIDITGTWKTLKPKLGRDNRTEVTISLCKFFGEIPSLRSSIPEKDTLINDVIPRLWCYTSSSNVEIIKAALKALSQFSSESYGPNLLPDLFKNSVEVVTQLNTGKGKVSNKDPPRVDDVDYIPGECWILFLQKIDTRVTDEAVHMLASLIRMELNSLARRFFCLPEEMQEPGNYSHLPRHSICRALVQHIKEFLETRKAREKNVPASVILCLRILSSDYQKNLPHLNWSFLQSFFPFDENCRQYAISILAKQAPSSVAGRKTLETYMVENLTKFKEVSDFEFLYSLLPFLCNSLTVNTLRQFLDKTMIVCLKHSLNTKSKCFKNVLRNINAAVESKVVPEPRKALLTTTMSNILVHIPTQTEIMNQFAEFVKRLPANTVKCITSLPPYGKITSDKLERSLNIRAALASQGPQPLTWFSECIDAVVNLPTLYSLFTIKVLDVLRQRRDLCHTDWISELMLKVQASTSFSSEESVNVTLFLVDIYIISILIITGYDCFSWKVEGGNSEKEMLKFFPIAVFEFLKISSYFSLSPKIIDWIYKLSKWKYMPKIYIDALEKTIFISKSSKHCLERSKWLNFLNTSTVFQWMDYE